MEVDFPFLCRGGGRSFASARVGEEQKSRNIQLRLQSLNRRLELGQPRKLPRARVVSMQTGASDLESLARRIYERSHLTGEFKLRSGATSTEYFDKYLFESDPVLLRDIAQALVLLLPERVDGVAGLELGGVPLATVVSQVAGLPALFVRKQAKPYGTCRLAEGGEVAGRRLAVIEDVISTGGQVVESCRALRERGAEIVAVLCVIDRESEGAANIAAEGLELRSAFTLTDLRAAAAA